MSAPQALDWDDIAAKLNRLSADVEVEEYIAGLRVDLLVRTPMGQRIIVQGKPWRSLDSAISQKAVRQIELYKQVTGHEYVLLVAPALEQGDPTVGVVTTSELIAFVEELIDREPKFSFLGGSKPIKRPSPSRRSKQKVIFVAMPFAARFEDTFFLGIAEAAAQRGLACVRLDQEVFDDLIIDRIHKEIERADGVIADLTEGNPNVLYELGYAHALKKPTIHLSAMMPEQLPFDVRGWQTLLYSFGQIHKLREQLMLHFDKLLQ